MIKKSFILSCITAVTLVAAQQKHTIVKGDTPYNIAKRYQMSLDDLYRLNPEVKAGSFRIGDVINVKGDAKASDTATHFADSSASGKIGKITLKPKQTIYGITKQYKISEAELRKLNPELDSHMKIGDKVALPLENIQKYGDQENEVSNSSSSVSETTSKTEVTETITETPVAQIDKNSYQIQEKDNYYKIGKKFGLSQKEIFALNPGLEEKGLHPGDIIIVKGNTPENNEQKAIETETTSQKENTNSASGTTSSDNEYITYTVQSGDTVFGILNKFGITLDELLALNPNLSNGLKAGMVLKIKEMDAMYVKKSGDALSVVLMLPFGFDANDAKYRTLSTDFLAGAKLAIERNVKDGMKLDVKIIDAGSESSFKNSLIQINPDNTDLIVGPFFKSSVLDVMDYVKKNKIPVVAPFANSQDLYDFSNLIIVETNESVFADRIIKEVKDAYSDQKIYIVADDDKTNANYLKSGLEKELKNPNIIIVNSPSEIKADQNMMTGQSAPVIAILANSKDNIGDAFGNKMIEIGKEVSGIKAFSMFYAPVFEKKVDDLSLVNLVYLMDRKINTEGDFEKEVLADFKQKYCKTPSKYNVIGFDVMNDMLARENKKGEILKQMGKSQTQLATKFEFERAKPNGAFINKGYRVVRLIP